MNIIFTGDVDDGIGVDGGPFSVFCVSPQDWFCASLDSFEAHFHKRRNQNGMPASRDEERHGASGGVEACEEHDISVRKALAGLEDLALRDVGLALREALRIHEVQPHAAACIASGDPDKCLLAFLPPQAHETACAAIVAVRKNICHAKTLSDKANLFEKALRLFDPKLAQPYMDPADDTKLIDKNLLAARAFMREFDPKNIYFRKKRRTQHLQILAMLCEGAQQYVVPVEFWYRCFAMPDYETFL